MIRSIKAFAIIFIIFSISGCRKENVDTKQNDVKNDETYAPSTVKAILDAEERLFIGYFDAGADNTSGLCKNNYKNSSTLTSGASGMGIMNLIAGVEHGWISRDHAVSQILKMEHFLQKADRFGTAWSHWYNSDGSTRAFGEQTAAGDIVETSFIIASLLVASEYFSGDNDSEKELRSIAEQFWNELDWTRFVHNGRIHWIWHSNKTGDDAWSNPLTGWNESLIACILALAAPEGHNITPEIFHKWQTSNSKFSNPKRVVNGYSLPMGSRDYGGPLFISQYTFLWLDPRDMQDKYGYYWTQVVGHAMINRHYCVYEAPAEYQYSEFDWGLTSCQGTDENSAYDTRQPTNDDGVIGITAAMTSFPFTPFYSTQVLLNLAYNYRNLNSTYGFYGAYRPASKAISTTYLGMEHAPMVPAIENYRSELFWNLAKKNKYFKKGLELAGISSPAHSEGFYLAIPESVSGLYDMMRHPDRGNYEIDFYSSSPGKGELSLLDSTGKVVYNTSINLSSGANRISFFDESVLRAKPYGLSITTPGGKYYSLPVCLR